MSCHWHCQWLLIYFAPHGFFSAPRAAGALLWPDNLAYDLSIALLVLCAARPLLQRRRCVHLPYWRILPWRHCAEYFLLSRDGLLCCGLERAAALLLERINVGWQWFFGGK